MQKAQVEDQCVARREDTVSTAVLVYVWPSDHDGTDSERKGGKVLALMNFECAEDDLLEHLKDV